MSASHRFYMKSKFLSSTSFEDDDLFINEDDENDFGEDVDGGYLQEVPYTSSSSVDRSSVASIPWADDAIKLNQLEWEKVEKMLSGIEPLATEEDLRHEILDWQKKFPILQKSTHNFKRETTFSTDTLNIDSLETLNISSDEEEAFDLDQNQNVPARRKTTEKQSSTEEISFTPTPTLRKSSEESSNLCQLLTSHSLKLQQREPIKKSYAIEEKSATSTESSPYSLHAATKTTSPPAPPPRRLRMPPILNVLESSRKFKSLGVNGGPNKNPSFVQLTHVQKPQQPQIKSALHSHDHIMKSDRYQAGRHRSAWQLPLAANRFFNSRNSIILPAISNRQHIYNHYAHVQPQNSISTASSSSVSGDTGGNALNTPRQTPQAMRANLMGTNLDTFKQSRGTNLSSSSSQMISSSTGRSISAAMQHPRAATTTNFSAFYLPYSASKFKAFK